MSERSGDFPANPFWDFSISVYGREGVGPACIALQDRRGLDVNILLWCCWVGAGGKGGGGVIDEAAMGRAVDRVAPWREAVVEPLRRARRAIHDAAPEAIAEAAEALRRKTLSAEIDGERVAQLILAGVEADPTARAGEGGHGDAAANLRCYLGLCGVAADAADRADLAVLLAAAFPDVAREEIERTML
jgi:uncharacterized protein (TIGR02444 family)